MMFTDKIKRLGIVFFLTFILFCFSYMVMTSGQMDFSYDSGFYTNDICVELTYHGNATIYYTVDGSEPEKDNGTTKVYEKGIDIPCREENQVVLLKTKAISADGSETKTFSHTYFMGKEISSRYSTYVVSISTDPDNLYGYENGIFVAGKLRDEYIAEYGEEDMPFTAPANYNLHGRESEREIYIEMFKEDGTQILSQRCGIRTGGNFSRTSEQKPFRIYAREEDYGTSFFDYDFFDYRKDDFVNGYHEFDKLYFRNSGNDRQQAYIRDELAASLANQAGFLDTQYFVPTCVYINGEYEGFYWMHSQFNESYFRQRYGNYRGEMVIIGETEKNPSTDTDDPQINKYAEEYMKEYKRLSNLDLTDDYNYQEVNSFLDIENYLQYYALQIYMCNKDWPHGNVQMYRYVSDRNEYTDGTVFDGRYRYLFYDVDSSMGYYEMSDSLNVWGSCEKLDELLQSEKAPLFKALMQREDCQKYFTEYMCYLIDEVFTGEKVTQLVDEIDASRRKELDIYIEYFTGYTPEEFKYLDMQLDTIRTWGNVNGEHVKWKLQDLWGLVK